MIKTSQQYTLSYTACQNQYTDFYEIIFLIPKELSLICILCILGCDIFDNNNRYLQKRENIGCYFYAPVLRFGRI